MCASQRDGLLPIWRRRRSALTMIGLLIVSSGAFMLGNGDASSQAVSCPCLPVRLAQDRNILAIERPFRAGRQLWEDRAWGVACSGGAMAQVVLAQSEPWLRLPEEPKDSQKGGCTILHRRPW